MLQEIAPKQYHVEFAFRAPKESGRCVVFRGMEILERLQDGQLFLPTYGELQDRVAECCYLFRIDEEEYYLTSLQETASVPEGYGWWSLRESRAKKARDLHFAETTAYHLSVL